MENLYRYLPDEITEYLKNYNSVNDITEIRLRADNTMQFTKRGKITDTGNVYITQDLLDETFFAMCEYSQNAYEDEISNGFITLEKGYRVGIGGEFYYSAQSEKYLLKKLHSLNIRVPQKIFILPIRKFFLIKNLSAH